MQHQFSCSSGWCRSDTFFLRKIQNLAPSVVVFSIFREHENQPLANTICPRGTRRSTIRVLLIDGTQPPSQTRSPMSQQILLPSPSQQHQMRVSRLRRDASMKQQQQTNSAINIHTAAITSSKKWKTVMSYQSSNHGACSGFILPSNDNKRGVWGTHYIKEFHSLRDDNGCFRRDKTTGYACTHVSYSSILYCTNVLLCCTAVLSSKHRR